MRRVCIWAFSLLVLGAAQGSAQLSYDPYYVLHGEARSKGVDVGISNTDIGSLGDVTDVLAMAKYALTDRLEVGGRVTLGFLNDGADSFQSLVVGAKYGVTERSALTANVLAPLGGIDDPGLSLGYMHTFESGSNIDLNTHLQFGLLDGYTGGNGATIDLLLELTRPLGDKITAYVDFLNSSNADDIGDNLAINLGPNVDIVVAENAVFNIGVTIGIAGDLNQDELGLTATYIMQME